MTALPRKATHPYARPQGPDLGRTEDGSRPVLAVIEGGRGKPDLLTIRATELADLIDELSAAGMDMIFMATRLDMAVANGRLDLIPSIAVRLRALGQMYRDVVEPDVA